MFGLIEKLRQSRLKKLERIIPQVQREQTFPVQDFFDEAQKQKTRKKKEQGEEVLEESVYTVPRRSAVAAQRDPGKRRRVFMISALIVLLVFGLKLWGQHDWSSHEMVLVAFVAGALTYVGLMWAFRFEFLPAGYLTVLPLPSLFVFGLVLFVELFFFQRFQRIYEALIFGALLLVFVVVLAVVFLTANVLNVATVKTLPLLQVAQTASYAVSLFSIFFVSYFIVDQGLSLPLTVALLTATLFVATFLHLSHFGLHPRVVLSYSTVLTVCSAMVAAVLLMWPVSTVFRVLLPTIVSYIGVGIVMHDIRKVLRPLIFWEYTVVLCIVLVILILNASWGIAGPLWA
ncbi:MAG: hypothetical protein PHG63_01095 [Candidatus Dojkabacteria bacterium]|nr:hypothetical protein [Candidatus Dojkabacteria bacterium]